MKKISWWAAAAPAMLALSACDGSATEAVPLAQVNHTAQTEATRELAVKFLTQAFIDGEFRDAYDTYGHPDLIQHNPLIADGLEGHRAYFTKLAEAQANGDSSKWAHVTDMLLVDGDIFAVMHHVYRDPEDKGRIFVDLWRVANGKIAEHWDVIQEIPDDIPHGNGMACGTANDHASAVTHQDSILEPTCGVPDPRSTREASLQYYQDYVAEVAKGDVISAIEKWFHPNYKQHSPIIADGKQGAIDYLTEEWGRADAPKPILGEQRIVAEGDLVLVHYLYELEGMPTKEAHIDIFRFTDGKMSEHWDVKQKIPEQSANENGMW
jgi:predicted SnoaL-like aldol condensation-catalyzing enzyme